MMIPEHRSVPLRILFVSHWFPRHDGDWGGVFVLEQAQALRAAGVDVRVLVAEPMESIAWRQPRSIAQGIRTFAAYPTPQWQERGGVPVAYVPVLTPHPRLWGALAPRSYIASLMRWRKALLADFTPRIVHAHTAFLDGYAAAWLARRLKLPLVLTEGTGPFVTLTRTSAQRRLTQGAVNAAAMLLPVSQFQLQAIRAAIDLSPGVKIKVVGNAFDPGLFHPFPLPSSPPQRFLWIGHLDENKQPLMLLEAFGLALTKRADLHLTLIGHGPLASAVEARLGDKALAGKVELHPSQDRAGIAAALRGHGSLVISSQTETFGVVAIEALGSGRPVLTTRCGGPEEIIAATGGGLVVGNSVSAIADGLLTMAESAAHFDPSTLASAAALRYGSKAIAQSLVETYGAVLQTGSHA
jgi:glycosyltransferase involved in cell wall biosynthesis